MILEFEWMSEFFFSLIDFEQVRRRENRDIDNLSMNHIFQKESPKAQWNMRWQDCPLRFRVLLMDSPTDTPDSGRGILLNLRELKTDVIEAMVFVREAYVKQIQSFSSDLHYTGWEGVFLLGFRRRRRSYSLALSGGRIRSPRSGFKMRGMISSLNSEKVYFSIWLSTDSTDFSCSLSGKT